IQLYSLSVHDALPILVTPLVLLVFQFDTVPNVWGVVLSLLCGALGYAVLGTLVGGMLGQVQMRGILLPLVLFPMVIPMFGIGVRSEEHTSELQSRENI